MKALEKDRARRYETASGFAADVAALLDRTSRCRRVRRRVLTASRNSPGGTRRHSRWPGWSCSSWCCWAVALAGQSATARPEQGSPGTGVPRAGDRTEQTAGRPCVGAGRADPRGGRTLGAGAEVARSARGGQAGRGGAGRRRSVPKTCKPRSSRWWPTWKWSSGWRKSASSPVELKEQGLDYEGANRGIRGGAARVRRRCGRDCRPTRRPGGCGREPGCSPR